MKICGNFSSGRAVWDFSDVHGKPWSQRIVDEAKAAGKTPADFPKVTADVFKPMDKGQSSEN
jgi:hypothetical protein